MSVNCLIPRTEFCRRLGIVRPTLRDWENPTSPRYKADLPKPVHLGARIRCYVESEVDAFLEAQAAKPRN